MSLWPDPGLPVSVALMAACADLEGAQTPSRSLVFCMAFCPSTFVVATVLL